MKDKQIELVIGSLLHDIGKVVYRTGDGRNHSQSGYEYLKELKPEFDKMILDCVRYHHGTHLKGAKLSTDHPAYLTYLRIISRRQWIVGKEWKRKMDLIKPFRLPVYLMS